MYYIRITLLSQCSQFSIYTLQISSYYVAAIGMFNKYCVRLLLLAISHIIFRVMGSGRGLNSRILALSLIIKSRANILT